MWTPDGVEGLWHVAAGCLDLVSSLRCSQQRTSNLRLITLHEAATPPLHSTRRHKCLMKCACFLQMWPLELQVRRLNLASTVKRIFRSTVCCSPLAPSSAAIILCTLASTRRSLRESRCAGARCIVYFFPRISCKLWETIGCRFIRRSQRDTDSHDKVGALPSHLDMNFLSKSVTWHARCKV